MHEHTLLQSADSPLYVHTSQFTRNLRNHKSRAEATDKRVVDSSLDWDTWDLAAVAGLHFITGQLLVWLWVYRLEMARGRSPSLDSPMQLPINAGDSITERSYLMGTSMPVRVILESVVHDLLSEAG